MSAFRTSKYRALCATCHDFAAQGCERCATPLCDAHVPVPGRLCADCERQYELSLGQARARYRNVGWAVLLGGNVGILCASRALGHGFSSLPIVAVATLLTWVVFVWMLAMPADDVFRRRFTRASRK